MNEEEKKEYNRRNVIREIIITEADYVTDLEVILNVSLFNVTLTCSFTQNL
jgi:hypothetical protein